MKKKLLGLAMALIVQNSVSAEINTHNFQIYNEGSGNKQLKYITFGNIKNPPTHNNNTVEWFYNSFNQSHSIFSEEDLIETIKRSMRSWSNISGVKFIYRGETTNNINNTNDGIITIGYWSEGAFTNKYGNFAGHTQIEWSNFKITEGYMILNAGNNNSASVPQNLNHLQGLITHEVGHLLGIDHSNIEESIMYANPYHSYEYQAILRNDDIAIASLLYPKSTIFNQGDTNGDDIINIQDVVASITIVLNNGSTINGSDCNDDGFMNIQDIVCTINRVLEQ